MSEESCPAIATACATATPTALRLWKGRDGAPMSCDLVFHGDGSIELFEAQFFERGELLIARRGFSERRFAIQWAGEIRKELEKS